ncbi:MAG: sulfotransferase [Gammaproteobacteria bacterium]|nr:sulfotransferase [Gammaproteobacteria bacterium]
MPPAPATFEREIIARLRTGDVAGAATVAAKCRAALPQARAGWHFGSVAALLAGQLDRALAMADDWLRAHPADAEGLLQRAKCHLARGERSAAMADTSSAIAAAGVPELLDAIGEFLFHAAEYPLALAAYDRALDIRPGDPHLHAKRGVMYWALGSFDRAAADYQAVLARVPGDPGALKALVELEPQRADHNYIGVIEGALRGAPADSKAAATLHLALAKSYEDMADYGASWCHLTAGNRIERSLFQYDVAADQAMVERLIESFPGVEPAGRDSTGESPIFIVGLPRTGTTLLERSISRHSQVHAAGELTALPEAVSTALQRASPDAVRDWPHFAARADAGCIAREYLSRVRSRRGERPRFTDKLPTNFLYCPLILRAFPRARIVHLTRHPLATCYAIFKARFAGAYPFAYDLGELGTFYLAYRRLMAHWHRILPGRIIDVAYEQLVTSLEPTVRGLCRFLDLPYEAQCLEFHLNPAPTSTASAVQVRRKLYGTSLEQWRNYRRELGTLERQLAAGGIMPE